MDLYDRDIILISRRVEIDVLPDFGDVEIEGPRLVGLTEVVFAKPDFDLPRLEPGPGKDECRIKSSGTKSHFFRSSTNR